MRTRTRIHPYVVPDIARRLNAYCGAKGLTESAAVQAAIEQYLEAGEKDNALILRRLDRLGRASAQHQRDLEVMSEALALFVRRWFASAPEIAPSDHDAAERLSAKRYQGFLNILADTLARASPRLVSAALRNATVRGEAEPSENKPATKMPSPPP